MAQVRPKLARLRPKLFCGTRAEFGPFCPRSAPLWPVRLPNSACKRPNLARCSTNAGPSSASLGTTAAKFDLHRAAERHSLRTPWGTAPMWRPGLGVPCSTDVPEQVSLRPGWPKLCRRRSEMRMLSRDDRLWSARACCACGRARSWVGRRGKRVQLRRCRPRFSIAGRGIGPMLHACKAQTNTLPSTRGSGECWP